ncbi:MAG: permease-like cell division protein FtsX [Clostridia bacterium]|nr:permease-like cell division protein FtsX [Clostridia bacterium]
MKKRRGSLGYLTKEGFRNVHTNRLMSIASIAVLMACLVMIGSAFMVLVNVDHIMNEIESENVVMVYLDQTATAEDVQTVKDAILANTNVLKCEFRDKETAFKEAIEDLDTDASYFDGVDNPLPDLFEVSLKDMVKFSETVSQLTSIEHVDTVRDNKDIANMLIRIRSTISYLSLGVIAVLMVISLFIIANTIRITMFSRRLEINIMKSVGATNWFIRWPFMLEGMILGVISAVISLGVVWGVYKLIEPTVTSMLQVVSADFSVVPFTNYIIYILPAFVLIGLVSGGIGSLISIQKYLKERGGVVYEEDE